MLWHNLRLRHRMLLGYGLMLVLIVALALFLMLRTNSLNTQIQRLGAEVTTEATTGARLAASVAATQQAVDRYFQQPTADHLGLATIAIRQLSTAIEDAQTSPSNLTTRRSARPACHPAGGIPG